MRAGYSENSPFQVARAMQHAQHINLVFEILIEDQMARETGHCYPPNVSQSDGLECAEGTDARRFD